MPLHLARVRLDAAPAGGVVPPRWQKLFPPRWQKLFPLGAVRHRADFPGGRIEFSRDFLQSLAANYAAEGKPERAVNFFHRGSSDGDATPIADKVAAGWISDLELDEVGAGGRDGPGLYALIAWTERARAFILADELRYLSPEFAPNAASKATGKPQGPTLLGAALLNDPYLTELPRVAASEHPKEKHGMNRKLICAALGLAEDATDEQINEACENAATAPPPSPDAGKAERLALAERVKASDAAVMKLTEQLAEMRSAQKARDVKAFFDRLVTEGRVTPGMREGLEKIAMAAGLEAVAFLEKNPVIVASGEAGVTGGAVSADQKTWDAKLAECEAKGMTGLAAFEATKLALPALWEKLGTLDEVA